MSPLLDIGVFLMILGTISLTLPFVTTRRQRPEQYARDAFILGILLLTAGMVAMYYSPEIGGA